jgi:uncharacterized protein (TIGR02271 family)
MQDRFTMERASQMRGETVYDSSGEKIGKVDEIFYDDDTNTPEWIGVGTGFFGNKRLLVPVQGASATDDGLTVAYDKARIKESPDISGDEVDEQTEAQLYSHYGLQASERRSDSMLPDGGVDAGTVDRDRQTGLPNADEQSLTRSEEELRVGKRSVDAGAVRLRKWVETEPVQADVALQRETVHVNREPVDQVVTGAEIGERTIEVPLTDEEAVVDKQVVAKERISLDKDVEERTETISDDVRKERVEVEGADGDDSVR